MPHWHLRSWAADFGANYQTKYLLSTVHFRDQHKGWQTGKHDHTLLAPAREVLSHFDIVGRRGCHRTRLPPHPAAPRRPAAPGGALTPSVALGRTEELDDFVDAIDRALRVPPRKRPAVRTPRTLAPAFARTSETIRAGWRLP